jgi:hypothetical protein
MKRRYEKRRPARGGARPVPRSNRSKAHYPATDEHTIFIVAEPFGCGIDVIAPISALSCNHPTYAAGFAAAAMLSTVHGWRVVDHCGGELA